MGSQDYPNRKESINSTTDSKRSTSPIKNVLNSTNIPQLQHPSETRLNSVDPDAQKVSDSPINHNDALANPSCPWFRHKHPGSDPSDDDLNTPQRHRNFNRHNAKAACDLQLEMELAGASTPLNTSNGLANSSFLSPMNKLSNLHLASDLDDNHSFRDDQDQLGVDVNSKELAYEDDDFVGDKTIMNDTSDSELDSRDLEVPYSSPPQYINRKRQFTDSMSDISMNTPNIKKITPQGNDVMMSTPSNSLFNSLKSRIRAQPLSSDLTNCDDMSMCMSEGKSSFSQSDSTPCPVQPKRKKLRFKNDNTPSNTGNLKKRILNLSSSVKTNINSIMTQLNDKNLGDSSRLFDDDPDEENEDGPNSQSTPNDSVPNISATEQGTPISQSTPANSRSSSPPLTQEFGDQINGYKFVKPKAPSSVNTPTVGRRQYFSYETPHRLPISAELRAQFTRNEFTPENPGKYKILGEIPVTSAGLMDESDTNIHVGDKRINDPYLTPKSDMITNDALMIKDEYLRSPEYEMLPLLPPHFHIQTELSKEEVLKLIGSKDQVREFYKLISEGENTNFSDLVKMERIRWHPDKWVGRFSQNDEKIWFDADVVNLLSQIINVINDSLMS